jgi:hypothetical protein
MYSCRHCTVRWMTEQNGNKSLRTSSKTGPDCLHYKTCHDLQPGATVYRGSIYRVIPHRYGTIHLIVVCTRAWCWILPWTRWILFWNSSSSLHINRRLNSNVAVVPTTNNLTLWNRSFLKKDGIISIRQETALNEARSFIPVFTAALFTAALFNTS